MSELSRNSGAESTRNYKAYNRKNAGLGAKTKEKPILFPVFCNDHLPVFGVDYQIRL